MRANLLGRSIVRSVSMTADQEVVPSSFFAHESMRASQQEMIADVLEALSDRGSLLAAAPTGIGKTAAALASALEVANRVHDFSYRPKILFMTGRQSQHKIVVETVRQINSNLPRETPRVKLVDIIGREGTVSYTHLTLPTSDLV